MLLGIVIGLAGLALVGLAYINRDPLSDTPAIRRLAPYVIGVVLSIAVGVAVIMLTTSRTDICGGLTNCGYNVHSSRSTTPDCFAGQLSGREHFSSHHQAVLRELPLVAREGSRGSRLRLPPHGSANGG